MINWGCSNLPAKVVPGQVVLNKPEGVRNAKCKLLTLDKLREAGVPHPPYWTAKDKASIPRKGTIIVARTTTRGSGGEGIIIVRPEDGALPEAPLYTQYVRKISEYRIHVMRDTVVMIQQKRRESDAEQTEDQKLIRNYDNGWIFAANNVEFKDEEQRQSCIRAAIGACKALGLDFGAVDLVVEKKTGTPSVLEVNTAPGVSSPTLLAGYATAFNDFRKGIQYHAPRPKEQYVDRARKPKQRASR